MPEAFEKMKKLHLLRISRNCLTSIDYLSKCSYLKILDVSHNKITSLDGLAGLQSLVELKCNNNCITSMKLIRSLPSLLELEISNNLLTSLDGLQHLPTLEILHAENNKIVHVTIPQTYSRSNIKLNKPSTNKPTSGGSASNIGSAAGSVVSNKSKSTKKGSTMKSNTVTNGDEVSETSMVTSNTHSEAIIGLPKLTDVFLSNNKLTSLNGLNTIGHNIEVLDIANNLIEDVNLIIEQVYILTNLYELNIEGNPISTLLLIQSQREDLNNDEECDLAEQQIHLQLEQYWCKLLTPIVNNNFLLNLKSIDGCVINIKDINEEIKMLNEGTNKKNKGVVENARPEMNFGSKIISIHYTDRVSSYNTTTIMDDSLFKTWDDTTNAPSMADDSTVATAETVPRKMSARVSSKRSSGSTTGSKNSKKMKTSKATASDSESNSEAESGDNVEEQEEYSAGPMAPKLCLRHVQTAEELRTMEEKIANLIKVSRRALVDVLMEDIPNAESAVVKKQEKEYEAIGNKVKEQIKTHGADRVLGGDFPTEEPPSEPDDTSEWIYAPPTHVSHNANGVLTAGHLSLPRPPIRSTNTSAAGFNNIMDLVNNYYSNIAPQVEKDKTERLSKPEPPVAPSIDDLNDARRPLSRGALTRDKSRSGKKIPQDTQRKATATQSAPSIQIQFEGKASSEEKPTLHSKKPSVSIDLNVPQPYSANLSMPSHAMKSPSVASTRSDHSTKTAAVTPRTHPAMMEVSDTPSVMHSVLKKFIGNAGYDARGGSGGGVTPKNAKTPITKPSHSVSGKKTPKHDQTPHVDVDIRMNSAMKATQPGDTFSSEKTASTLSNANAVSGPTGSPIQSHPADTTTVSPDISEVEHKVVKKTLSGSALTSLSAYQSETHSVSNEPRRGSTSNVMELLQREKHSRIGTGKGMALNLR